MLDAQNFINVYMRKLKRRQAYDSVSYALNPSSLFIT